MMILHEKVKRMNENTKYKFFKTFVFEFKKFSNTSYSSRLDTSKRNLIILRIYENKQKVEKIINKNIYNKFFSWKLVFKKIEFENSLFF